MRLQLGTCLLLTSIITSLSLNALAQLDLSAEVRPRGEYRHGFKKLYGTDDSPACFVEQRTRLNASYVAEKYKIGLVLQDVRIWGETAQINKSDGLTSFHEAWSEILFSKKFSVKVGRQELVYDDQRILGNLDWAAQARSHDAVIFKFADSTLTLHAGFAFNQDSKIPEPLKLTGNYYSAPGGFTTLGGGLPNYQNMEYVWFQKLFGKSRISGLVMNTGWLDGVHTALNNLVTAGLNPSIYLSKTLQFTGSIYYQTGNDRLGKSVGNAWLLSAALQTQAINGLPLSIGMDLLTGSKPGSTTSSTFDPLFGSHHAFYGHMDYFYVGNPSAQQGETVGLVDIFAKTTVKTGKQTSLILHAHEFLSQVPIIDPLNTSQDLPSALGGELDAIFNFDYDKSVNIKVGYSQLMATHSMEVIKGGDKDKLQNWGWLMLTVKPSLLSLPLSK